MTHLFTLCNLCNSWISPRRTIQRTAAVADEERGGLMLLSRAPSEERRGGWIFLGERWWKGASMEIPCSKVEICWGIIGWCWGYTVLVRTSQFSNSIQWGLCGFVWRQGESFLDKACICGQGGWWKAIFGTMNLSFHWCSSARIFELPIVTPIEKIEEFPVKIPWSLT